MESTASGQIEYTPHEISAHLQKFYTFLTTLHYHPSDLKLPPSPSGWPSLSPALCTKYNLHLYKSPLALETLRQIPYFSRHNPVTSIHYKSVLLDWDSIGAKNLPRRDGSLSQEDEDNLHCDECLYKPNKKDMILLATGHESGGRNIWLDCFHERIYEEAIRDGWVGNWSLIEYLDILSKLYRELRIIPAVGRVQLPLAYHTPERDVDDREGGGQILLEEVLGQGNEIEFGCTELDVQFVRQEYRRMGWPDCFRKEEAEDWVSMMDRVCEGRRDGGWETEDFCM